MRLSRAFGAGLLFLIGRSLVLAIARLRSAQEHHAEEVAGDDSLAPA